MRKDSFELTPLNPIERCSPLSVAAHTLYEKTRPDLLPGPGGILDLVRLLFRDDSHTDAKPHRQMQRMSNSKMEGRFAS